jgi:cAMP-dependent protein kinase regulator
MLNKLAKLSEKQKRLPEEEEGEGSADENEDQDEEEAHSQNSEHSEESEEDDAIDELPVPISAPPKFRKSVSAEAYGLYNKKGYFSARIVQKKDDTRQKIKDRLMKSFMFNTLDESDLNIVIDAMEEKVFNRNDTVIEQNADGDELFVVGEGKLHCYRNEKGEVSLVKTYNPGDYFGELALLYNAPRAATIKAIKNGVVLYSLDRLTFNHIVKDSAIKRRERYEEILKQVKVLDSLDNFERGKLIDAISEMKFKAGDEIIKQGEPGNKFYFIMEGKAVAKKALNPGDQPETVMNYKEGDYFGEVALLKDQPRAASVIAETDLVTLYLDRQMFNRLLGPLKDILKRNMELYVHFETKEHDV